jgi:hypothetical protein
MLRGDSVNIREEGVGVGVDFSDFQAVAPICQDERASLLYLGPDIANSHRAVKCAGPHIQTTQFTSNNGRIIIFQEIMLFSFSISELFSL